MTNTSATGGYILPVDQAIPGGLSLEDFLVTVVVGITGIDGTLVRPRWQIEPPKEPAQTIDWAAVGVKNIASKGFAYIGPPSDSGSTMQQHEFAELVCSFYGPNSVTNATHFRDGLQISQNRDQLFLAGMGIRDISGITRVPELVNNLWNDRNDITVTIAYEVNRVYPILYFVEALGSIITDTIPQITVDWDVEE